MTLLPVVKMRAFPPRKRTQSCRGIAFFCVGLAVYLVWPRSSTTHLVLERIDCSTLESAPERELCMGKDALRTCLANVSSNEAFGIESFQAMHPPRCVIITGRSPPCFAAQITSTGLFINFVRLFHLNANPEPFKWSPHRHYSQE